jgi:hypothetical protein
MISSGPGSRVVQQYRHLRHLRHSQSARSNLHRMASIRIPVAVTVRMTVEIRYRHPGG